MRSFTKEELVQLDKRYKNTLLNSLNGVKTVSLIGTANKDYLSNLAVFNSITHIGANPSLIGLFFRPDKDVERHTLTNIKNSGYCTINMIHHRFFQKAHQTSAKYPASVSEFLATGFNKEWKDGFAAPYVMDAHIQVGWELKESHTISINNTLLVVGEIKHLYINSDLIGDDGFVDHAAAGTLLSSGLDAYLSARLLGRMEYARPDEEPRSLISES